MKIFKQIPSKISFDSENLMIQWKDTHQSIWNLIELRKVCPCAVCCGGDFGEIGTMTSHIKEAKILSYEIMGRYAISIKWKDGHNTGIYTYVNLRKTCECKICRKNF